MPSNHLIFCSPLPFLPSVFPSMSFLMCQLFTSGNDNNSKDVCVCVCVCTRALSHLSRVQLFVTLWTAAHQSPLSIEVSRQEYWSGLPCSSPENFPDPGIGLASLSSALASRFFTTSATWGATSHKDTMGGNPPRGRWWLRVLDAVPLREHSDFSEKNIHRRITCMVSLPQSWKVQLGKLGFTCLSQAIRPLVSWLTLTKLTRVNENKTK